MLGHKTLISAVKDWTRDCFATNADLGHLRRDIVDAQRKIDAIAKHLGVTFKPHHPTELSYTAEKKAEGK